MRGALVWGLGGLPYFFFNFKRFYVCFNAVFMRLGQYFSRFGHNILLKRYFFVARETKCWTKSFSGSHDFFFTFFLQHVSLT